jgi:drug/metabolite transporter (DMT)-like permease
MSIPRTIGWGVALATTTALISGVSVFANGLIVKEFADPVVLTGVRNAVVGAVLLAVLIGTGGMVEVRALSRRTGLALAGIALVGGSIPFILFFSGLAAASGPGAAIIHKTLFVWVAILAVPFLGERLGIAQVGALAILIAGTMLIGPTGELGMGTAELMILAATLLWAVEVVIARRLLSRDEVSVRLATTARMALGALVILGFLAVTGRFGGIAALSAWQWTLILGTGLLLLGYVTTWYAALQRAPASLVSSILVGGAVVTAVLAVARTGTAPAPAVETGLLLLAVGVGMAIVVAVRRPAAWTPSIARTADDGRD